MRSSNHLVTLFSMFGPNSVFLKFWSHIQTKTQIPANPNPDLNSEKNELVKEQVLTVQGGLNLTHCQVTKPPPPPLSREPRSDCINWKGTEGCYYQSSIVLLLTLITVTYKCHLNPIWNHYYKQLKFPMIPSIVPCHIKWVCLWSKHDNKHLLLHLRL